MTKVMWLGRATVFLVGLAMIVALVFGAASIAFGANGKPFILGRGNTATKVSTLNNKGTGAALSLKVQPGQPPLAVNSLTKVGGLNADQVDGKDSSGFVANNTYLLGPGQERAGQTLSDGSKVLSQSCLSGDRLLAGGPASVNVNSDVLDSFPTNTTTWQARINDSAVSGGDKFTVVVLCADQ